jgi:flagellar FliL protein
VGQDEEIDLTDVEGSGVEGLGEEKAKKGLSEGLARILIWVIGILVGLVVVITVSVITYRIMDKKNTARNFPVVSQEYQSKPENYVYFDLIGQIRTRTSDRTAYSVIVTPLIGYDTDDSTTVGSELTAKSAPLTDQIRNYFSQKTVEELKPDQEAILKEELKSMINGVLSSGQIKSVIFTEFQVIEN